MSTIPTGLTAQDPDPLAGLGLDDIGIEYEEPKWVQFYNLRVGAGYNDNVLLSRFVDQSSPLTFTEFDAVWVRLPENGFELTMFLSGYDIRYLGPGISDKDQSFFATVTATKELSDRWKAGLETQYIYLDQVFDSSSSIVDRGNIKSQLHQGILRPSLTRRISKSSSLAFEFQISRSEFLPPADDEWEVGPRLSYQKKFGAKSDWRIEYGVLRNAGDTTLPVDLSGFTIPGEGAIRTQHEIEFRVRHYWDEALKWRSSTRLIVQANRNNGSTFYDFDRYRISQQLRYRGERWELQTQATFSFYNYDSRTVSATNPEKRKRNRLNLETLLQRRISRRWKLFGRHTMEFANSNRVSDDYTAHVIIGGIEWEYDR